MHISNNNYTLYAVDDWRVSNRLTLNLGIRWEGIPHAYDSEGTASNFYPNLYDPKQAATFLPSGALDTNGPGFTTVPGIHSVECEVLHERRRDSRTERNSAGSGG